MDDLMKQKDLADALGLTVKTLANWRWQRRGPTPIRISGRVYYRHTDVTAWIDKQASAAESDGWAA